MQPVVINPKTKDELKFISDLLKKLNISSHILTEEEAEDLGMMILMNEADRARKVSRNTIMRKLRS
jgi:hypothetical protein